MMDGVKIGVLLVRGCAKHGSERIGVCCPDLCFQVDGDVAGVRFRWTMYARCYVKLHVDSALYSTFDGICIVHDDVAAIRFQRTTLAKGCVKLNVDSM
ncbi:hypothetical protein Tco_1395029, partial [Tanacetum coccineum]